MTTTRQPTAKAFDVDGDIVCAGCIIQTETTGFTRVQVAADATCDWCDAEHLSMMLAVRSNWGV